MIRAYRVYSIFETRKIERKHTLFRTRPLDHLSSYSITTSSALGVCKSISLHCQLDLQMIMFTITQSRMLTIGLSDGRQYPRWLVLDWQRPVARRQRLADIGPYSFTIKHANKHLLRKLSMPFWWRLPCGSLPSWRPKKPQ